MEKLKNSIGAKVLSFLVIQVCVVTIVFSGIVVVFNAGYSWYSSDSKSVREDILQEIAMHVECEIHDRLYYHIDYSGEGEIEWSEYILKGYDLPEGIGYKIELLKDKSEKIPDIKLKKNTSLNESESVYSQELYDDLYKLTVYVEDPQEVGKATSEIYPENLAVIYEFYNLMYKLKTIAIAALVLALIVLSLMFAYMISAIRPDAGNGGIVRKVPVDLAFGISGGAVLLFCVTFVDAVQETYNYDLLLLLTLIVSMAVSVTVTAFVLFFIYRVKCGKWWDNTVIGVITRYFIGIAAWMFGNLKKTTKWLAVNIKKTAVMLNRGVHSLPVVWRTVVVIGIVIGSNLLVTVNFAWSGTAQFFWIVGAIVISVAVIYIALCMKRLQKGGCKLAEGDLNHKIETKGLFFDFAEHAENLNKIGDGMSVAVEERIKSERFKAELITNVSHDIKTPLTSIINYVDLLNKKEIDDPEIQEYIDVLDRQSKRLKKLTEDIVDASKASTGNIKMEMAPCKIGLLMSQTVAEYKSKAEENDLEIILKTPEEELEILADGRRLWRVFDNLMNNICKYGQPGTRVYLALEETDGKAVITYRNISKYELDITEKELMERFVRGDKSRHTEGSGLGLSIARNLVELQDGTFDLNIDGDLFKVVITFNLLKL